MTLSNNPVCRVLGIKYPLIQAPMNWINNAEMVAAVSNAGALGVLGPNAGPKEIDGRRVPTEERIGIELLRIRQLTSAPVGINIFSAHDDSTRAYAMKTIAAAKANDVNVYCLVGTFDDVIYKAIKGAGGIIVHRELTPTAASARVAEEHGADIIVATGIDEGGMIPSGCMGTFTIVPTIVDAVKSVPVMAAGGINDIRGVRAAFALGASGVYVGTRFITSSECPAAQDVKNMIVAGSGEEVLAVTPNERSLPTPAAIEYNRRLLAGESAEAIHEEIMRKGGLGPAMLHGDVTNGIVSVNTGISSIRSIKPIADIVGELMADFAS
ncbi:MAG: nitronate monooxygenase [[Clostridium] fimetarium]|nr:nitronate monooxygenase [Alistipes timonensis]MCM1405496.1 nitronate monooxygenase [[Clostridium] fimetarium]